MMCLKCILDIKYKITCYSNDRFFLIVLIVVAVTAAIPDYSCVWWTNGKSV